MLPYEALVAGASEGFTLEQRGPECCSPTQTAWKGISQVACRSFHELTENIGNCIGDDEDQGGNRALGHEWDRVGYQVGECKEEV